jgi:hypothetical protein
MNRRLITNFAVLGSAVLLTGVTLRADDDENVKPDGKGGTAFHQSHSIVQIDAGPFARSGTGIQYHGGPVMLGTVNVYYIYYGNWTGSTLTTAQSLLSTYAQSIGGTPYHNIETTYFNGSNQHVSNSVAFGRSFTVGSPFGNNISDSQLTQIVQSVNPTDTNGVYFVLTSPEVNETSGFCTQYCGFHTRATINGHDIKYSFVGDGARCPSACSAQTTTPNGNLDADEMANVITHEMEEAISDPDLNAWFDRNGNENGDKCNFNFGATFTTSNGAQANQTFGGRNWLIQQNWINSGSGGCRQHNP